MPSGYKKDGSTIKYWLGKNRSQETKEKIKVKHLGKHFSPSTEFKKGMVSYWRGRKGRVSPMKGKKQTEEAKKKISLHCHQRGKKLSPEHLKKMIRYGEKNNKWRGGTTTETQKRVQEESWKKLRKLIYARDNWTCQKCFKKCHKDIQCHHIIPFRITKDDRKENLVTLCKGCHLKEELKFFKTYEK